MGNEFPTKDGSAQRDYIHVTDLVEAHLQLMFALKGNDLLYYNVGNGRPYTVLEIVEVVKRISGKPIPLRISKARAGDPPILYADPAKIKFEIGWKPKSAAFLALPPFASHAALRLSVRASPPRYPDIDSMVRHGWNWRISHYGLPPAASVDPLMHDGAAFTPETDTAAPLKDNPHLVIVGAGPTGLCAAYRLTELGYTNWQLIEGSEKPAGLACTIGDDNGFSWDIGVHCLFSHFEFFDALLDEMLAPKEWLYHQRYSPARMRSTWVGYPVQANLWRLPQKEVVGIVADLAQKSVRPRAAQPRTFEDWLVAGFGKALTETFMAPYNAKVWAHPAHEMNFVWVGERVAEIKLDSVLGNIINRRDAPAWGPNAQFRYPMNGTGHIWVRLFDELPAAHRRLGARVTAVRTAGKHRRLELADGTHVPFDGLLSTMPVVSLLRMVSDRPDFHRLAEGDNGAADHSRFKHQSVNLVGIGVWGTGLPTALNGVHWVYFPESKYIFYRATVLSNFSPLVVGKPYQQWSLLVEVSESRHRVVPTTIGALKAKVLEGLYDSGMLPRTATIATTWTKRLEYGYPVPYVERNMHMHEADSQLRGVGIWSRGRFGSWKYEVGNQDHSCMLGVDAVDSMLFGGNAAGREATFNVPNEVNQGFRRYDREFNPVALAQQAGRSHSFGTYPRRMRKKPQWDWVLLHCSENDTWVDRIRTLMVGLPQETKWLVHGYERCDVATTKRPMMDMLREGLNHHDRIPLSSASLPSLGWIRHIVEHYRTLPEFLFFSPASVPTSSPLFAPTAVSDAISVSPDFSIWGSQVVEMPASMQTRFCAKVWPLAAKARKRTCPDRIVTMTNAVMRVSRTRILATPHETWRRVLALLEGGEAANEQLLAFGWHLLLGQPAVLHHRVMVRH